jgi:hypothetical protein
MNIYGLTCRKMWGFSDEEGPNEHSRKNEAHAYESLFTSLTKLVKRYNEPDGKHRRLFDTTPDQAPLPSVATLQAHFWPEQAPVPYEYGTYTPKKQCSYHPLTLTTYGPPSKPPPGLRSIRDVYELTINAHYVS